jgi:hypothetical protein
MSCLISGENRCPLKCPVIDYSGHMTAFFVLWYACKSLALRGGIEEEIIPKPWVGSSNLPRPTMFSTTCLITIVFSATSFISIILGHSLDHS